MTIHTTAYDSIHETIGNTPLVAIHDTPAGVDIYAKLESFNPGGSVKDRIGYYILDQLIQRGELAEGDTIVEPTAGNTGIGMAIAAKKFDLEPIFVVPHGFSVEKETLMKALGAEIISIPSDGGMTAAAERAHAIAEEKTNAVVPQQFTNKLNVEAHYQTTGREVVEALGSDIGALVVGIGSGGTLIGMAQAIREVQPDLFVVAVEPEGSLFGTLRGCHRNEQPYKTEGIGTHDPEVAALFDPATVDDVMTVSDQNAHAEVARLAAEEGHLVGSSAAAASHASRSIATQIANGNLSVPASTVVTVFPDSSERYLSKKIYNEFEDWEGKS